MDPREVAEDIENFLVGGAGGLRRVPPRGVDDLEEGFGLETMVVVRDEADKLDAADSGLSIVADVGVGG